MKIPRYKDFGQFVSPYIKKFCRGYSVQIVVDYDNGIDQTTTGLIPNELRELADYLDYLNEKER